MVEVSHLSFADAMNHITIDWKELNHGKSIPIVVTTRSSELETRIRPPLCSLREKAMDEKLGIRLHRAAGGRAPSI